MPTSLRLARALLPAVLGLLSLPRTGSAEPVRLVSQDDRGVTLQLVTPRFALLPRDGGRVELVCRDMATTADSGRALLPFASVLVAVPPGASARVRVLAADAESVMSVRVALGGRAVMRDDPVLGRQPALVPATPILDGPWPATAATVGAPFVVRQQHMVAVHLMPFRYDESAGRLWARHALTVRIEFVGGAVPAVPGAPETHVEPVLRNLVINPTQAARFRAPKTVPPLRRIAVGGRLTRSALPMGLARGAAFDEGEPEVRVRLDSTGVYGFDFDSLQLNGYPAGVPVGEVSVHRHEYVPDASPAYVTIELPIEVDDANANGVFDSGDRILMWAQSWAERARASLEQREWGDAEVVYATRLRGGAGLRMATRPGWRSYTGLTPLASYPWVQRFEKTFNYDEFFFDTTSVDRFAWTFPYMFYYDRQDSIAFETNDLDTTRAGAFHIHWNGTDYGTHIVWAQITRNAHTPQAVTTYVADSVTWGGLITAETNSTVPGSAFSPGLTNRLAMWGKPNAGPPDPTNNFLVRAQLDWFEASYWRRYHALQGYLSCSSADASGPFQVHATGYTFNQMEVWDVSDSTAPTRLTGVQPAQQPGGAWTVDFQDSAGTQPKRYVAWEIPKSPGAYQPVTRRGLADPLAAHDYILITPESLLPAVAPLVNLRRAQGLDVVVAPLESVNDEFNGGRKSKWAIKRFVRFASQRWGSQFLLLVGDGSQDGRNLLPYSGKDLVPIAPINSNVQAELIAGDPWYAWCLDDDPNCYFELVPTPELFVGRLPVQTLAEANAEVAKIVNYENLAVDPLWRRHMLLVADDAYSGTLAGDLPGSGNYCFVGQELSFRTLTEVVRSVILDEAGLRQCVPDTADLRSYLTTPSLYDFNGADTCRTSLTLAENVVRSTLTPRLEGWLSDGVLWWNYQGHANQWVLAHERFFTNGAGENFDWQDVHNDNRPFLFSAFSCHANDFARHDEMDPQLGRTLGENLMNAPNRCAVASWASTGFELVPTSFTYHLNVEQARAMFSNPPRDPDLGDRGARVVLGEAIEQAVVKYVAARGGNFLERFVGLTYNLLGDPATRFSIGPPQIFVTVNGDTVQDNQPVRLSATSDTLRIEADFVSNVKLDSVKVIRVDPSGSHVVPDSEYTLTPALGDTSTDQRAYHLSFLTTLGGSTVRYLLQTTDRYGLVSTFHVVFELQTVLLYRGVPVANGDVIPPDASQPPTPGLALLLISPTIVNPATDITLQVDSLPQPFTATPARGDTTGRMFLLTWTHAPYAPGTHTVTVDLNGSRVATHTFVSGSTLAISNLIPFPNPFDQDGMRFAFYLEGDATGRVLVRVFTSAGRMVWQHEQDVEAGHYMEIPWDGRDSDGDNIANGVYFYRLTVRAGGSTVTRQGPIVKLRRPHRIEETAVTQ